MLLELEDPSFGITGLLLGRFDGIQSLGLLSGSFGSVLLLLLLPSLVCQQKLVGGSGLRVEACAPRCRFHGRCTSACNWRRDG